MQNPEKRKKLPLSLSLSFPLLLPPLESRRRPRIYAGTDDAVRFPERVDTGGMLKYAGGTLITAGGRIRSSVMENQTENKVYLQYNHTDSCRHARWTARECFEFMYAKPWQKVIDFYSNIVNNGLPLSCLFETERSSSMETSVRSGVKVAEGHEETEDAPIKDRTGRWARANFKIVLSYNGGSFDGWQKQPDLNSVQGFVEKSIGTFIDEKKIQELKNKSLPLEGNALVAGRTDKGVTALNQVCSFYTWRKDVKTQDVKDAINCAAPGKLRVVSVSKVSRDFHPNFSAKWRRYVYIFPFVDGVEQNHEIGKDGDNTSSEERHSEQKNGGPEYVVEEKDESPIVYEENEENVFENGKKPKNFSIQRVNQLLLQLEGKTLSYAMFARDTKASRSTGPPTECFIYHARATEARLPCLEEVNGNDKKGPKVMCVELIGNRFLRRMVRVLVATSIREAAAGADDDALLKLMEATCRRATAPPAPPDGLCLVDVGYDEFNPENCLVP